MNLKTISAVLCVIIIAFILIFILKAKGIGQSIPISSQKATPTVSKNNELDANSQPTTMSLPFDVLSPDEIKGKRVTISTDKGAIVIELSEDAPIASSNFISLINSKFYDGLTFHRRDEGFVIQGGDPNGNGTGGPGYKFSDEQVTGDYNRGIVAMANAGPNTNGSQFFIMLADAPDLPKSYTIFGNVISGMNVVDQIKVGDVMTKLTVE